MKRAVPETCPPEVLGWIPFYPDEGLSPEQRGAVESHAAGCNGCRDEIAMLALRAEPAPIPVDPERLFASVLARIEGDAASRGDRPRAAAIGEVGAPLGPAVRTGAAPSRRWRPAASRWAAAAGLVLVAAGAGWQARDLARGSGPPVYRTASAAPAPVAGAAAQDAVALDVVFRSDASAERINTALRGLGAAVVSGPTQLGRYRLALPAGTDAAAAAALLRDEGTGVASFAEPITP